MHFVESNAGYASYDDFIRSSPLRVELKKRGINNYEKADKKVFKAISNNIDDARKRTERINQTTIKSSFGNEKTFYNPNPFRKVHKLLDAIDGFIS